MSRRGSAVTIRLDDSAIDHRGVAVIDENDIMSPTDDNSTIAPWVDVPPTPPPKSPNRAFGFGSKASLSSFVTLRHNSASSIRSRSSDSQSTLSLSTVKRRSTDDSSSSSSRYLLDSGSSTYSSELKKQKSALNVGLLTRLKPRSSKVSLQVEDRDTIEEVHPSLRPPVPSISENTFLIMPQGPSLASMVYPTKKNNKITKKKHSATPAPPSPPPKDVDEVAHQFHIDMNFEDMNDIVNPEASAGSLSSSLPSSTPSLGDSRLYMHPPLDFFEFRDPFRPSIASTGPTPTSEKRKAIISANDHRRVSPTTILPSTNLGLLELALPGNPNWTPPASWAVEAAQGDTVEEEGTDVDDEDSPAKESPSNRQGSLASMDTVIQSEVLALEQQLCPSASIVNGKLSHYNVKILIQGTGAGKGLEIVVGPSDTVASLTPLLNSRLVKTKDLGLPHRLYLREKGRGDLLNDLERILAPTDRPADIVRRRLEQAGYDPCDGEKLLEKDGYSFLLGFVYKSQLLGSPEYWDNEEHYAHVDLTGRSLRVIPVALHRNAGNIVLLKLSRNPMLDLPLDFIQSCTQIKDLRLSNMAMKKVPSSLHHSATLEHLDLSCNRINDLDEAHLEDIPNLKKLLVQNNRIEKLPFLFPRLKTLTSLNISNNKFSTFPSPVTQLVKLEELDVSFNMITDIPPEIGRLKELKWLTIVGNQISRFPMEFADLDNLQMLDCRRNQISDLSIVCTLPQLRKLKTDHNAVHALDLFLGEELLTLDVSHNDITKLALIPGPLGHSSPFALKALDLSYGKLSSLDDQVLRQLTSLETLRLDHNSLRFIPDAIGDLIYLETLSCSDNKLNSLPETIGKLQKLEILDAHNNSLRELPNSLWNCASLTTINVTSNFIDRWHDPPMIVMEHTSRNVGAEGSLSISRTERKGSTASSFEKRGLPSLVYSLTKLYMGENKLRDEDLRPLMIFMELHVLNLSFNGIQDLPRSFFKNMSKLEELYLSGNRLTSIPAEDLLPVKNLGVLFLNGNKLQTLPTELAKIQTLRVLDVGSNSLKYNINNWEFDWNWNFNRNLKYLNLSGNKRLHIKSDAPKQHLRGSSVPVKENDTVRLSGFSGLKQLHMLGLMDVTITANASVDAMVDIPDESDDCRVRTSLSTVNGMGYGIADSLWANDHLNIRDLVHEFREPERADEAIFAIFSRVHSDSLKKLGANRNKPLKFLHEHFVRTFVLQQKALDPTAGESIKDALRRTFLKLDCDLYEYLFPSDGSAGPIGTFEYTTLSSGVTGTALYFKGKTMHVANVGDTMAIISRRGVAEPVSRKHHPYDRQETSRIRAAEGWVSPPGLVNGEIGVSRAFGFYHLLPVVNARPDVISRELTELDEFVIVANRGLWDFVPYQTAVDIARTVLLSEQKDAMIAAQKLRDFAISYGANNGTMIMVIHIADLFPKQSPDGFDPQIYRAPKLEIILDKEISRLTGEVHPPTGHLALVFTDIRNSTHLWEVNPGMPTAMRMHNNLLRRQLRFCGGYEVKTEGDAFMCSFPNTLSAVWWCLTVQHQLLEENWPLEILECEDGKPIYDAQGRLVARGLSVRMGIHCGTPVCEPDPITHRMDYFGPMVNRSARINGRAAGGQIMCSADVIREINAKIYESEKETQYSATQPLEAIEAIRRMGVVTIPIGEVKLKGLEFPELLSAIYPLGLEGRHDLDDEPAEHNPSGSRVQFSIAQMHELGVICLRIEALASGRIFRPTVERKSSIPNMIVEEDIGKTPSIYFEADPDALLPPLKENATDGELMILLESLSIRIFNALSHLSRVHSAPTVSKDAVISVLAQAGGLDEEKLQYLASLIQNL